MNRIGALLQASFTGFFVYAAALAIGACVWLLGPIQFTIFLDFPYSVSTLQPLADEFSAPASVSAVEVVAAPESSVDECGAKARRMLVLSNVRFFEFPGVFQEVSAKAHHAGSCGTGFVLGGSDRGTASLLAYGSLPVAAGIVFLLLVARRRTGLWSRVAGWTPQMSMLGRVSVGCAAAPVMIAGQYIVYGVADAFGLDYGWNGVDQAPASLLVALLPLTTMTAPVVEEYAFRGIILERYLRHLSTWPALLLGAVVFAVPHFPPTAVDFASLVWAGLALGGVWVLTRSLAAVIAAHALHNAIATLISLGGW